MTADKDCIERFGDRDRLEVFFFIVVLGSCDPRKLQTRVALGLDALRQELAEQGSSGQDLDQRSQAGAS